MDLARDPTTCVDDGNSGEFHYADEPTVVDVVQIYRLKHAERWREFPEVFKNSRGKESNCGSLQFRRGLL